MILLLHSVSVSARPAATETQDGYFTVDGVRGAIEFALGFNDDGGFDRYNLMYQPLITVESAHVTANTGLQVSAHSLDAMATGIWWPLTKNRMRIGAGLLYHYMYYDGLSSTHDVLPGIYMEVRPSRWFGLHFDTSYMYKARTIYAIQDYTPVLDNHSIAFSLQLNFYLPSQTMLYAKVSSYERFRYNVLCAPSFSLGLTHDTSGNVFFNIEGTARYTDFFTLSGYHDSNELRLALGLHL